MRKITRFHTGNFASAHPEIARRQQPDSRSKERTPDGHYITDRADCRFIRRVGFLLAFLLPVLLFLSATIVNAQISKTEYASRRAGLRSILGDGIYLFKAELDPTGRQDPNFNYLTGIGESNAILLMVQNRGTVTEYLFMKRPDPARASWDAAGIGEEGARALTGMEVKSLQEFETVLMETLRRAPSTIISTADPIDDEEISGIIKQMTSFPRRPLPGGSTEIGLRFVNADRILSEMRGVKSAAEIDLLEVAGNITRLAHIEAMKVTEPGMNEFEVQAAVEYTFQRYGAARNGFPSIIGSGPNSQILHYDANTRFMEVGDIAVMDIGAEYFGYTVDVTRTIPISGRYTDEQREIYEIVLAAHEAARELAEVEGTPYSDLSVAAERVLAEGLARLGLIESAQAGMPNGRGSQMRLYYFHGLGHGIGLVVHDSMPRNIGPGSCFTIEPGIYVRPNVLDMLGEGADADALRAKLEPAVRRYQNIGVRIEDSYVFTDEGLICLSEGIPRTVEEVENMMAQRSDLNRNRDADLVNRYRVFIPPE